jgi:hypothetical protein
MIDGDYQEEYRKYRFETKQVDKFTGTTKRGLTIRSCLSFSSSSCQSNQYRPSNLRYDLRYTGSPPQ